VKLEKTKIDKTGATGACITVRTYTQKRVICS
jgi:hypothetical protein